MSKQHTIIMPNVPTELLEAFSRLPPPDMSNMVSMGVADRIVDAELTFDIPDNVDSESDFIKAANSSMILATIVFFQAKPETCYRLLLHLVKTDPEWQRRAGIAKEKNPKHPDTYLFKWYIHDLIVKGGDIYGVDHRPCWDSGDCLHEKEEREKGGKK